MEINKFPSIESLRHVVDRVKANAEYHGLDTLPTVKFRGTVKLHGTNGGVRMFDHKVVAQGRNRDLSITSDNYGFAHFVAGREKEFNLIRFYLGSGTVTVYGEWCGQGIQSKVGVASLPRMFVIFAAYNHDRDEWLSVGVEHFDPTDLAYFNERGIFLVEQAPTYEVTIDFNDPIPAAETISRLTLQVEDACPFAHLPCFSSVHKGENIGIGEGIVWVSTEGFHERLTFKSKGEKHKKGGPKTHVAVDPEKVATIAALVDVLLPEWRLEQGFDHLRESNLPIASNSTGDYLKWIAKDILKEEADQIAANPYPWRDIQGAVMVRAKEYFFNRLNAEAGLA